MLMLQLKAMAQATTVAQNNPITISKTLTAYPGEVYVDSIRTDVEKIYLDPENILETKVCKAKPFDDSSGTATLITRKVKGDIISLAAFANSIKAGSAKLKNVRNLNLMVNDRYIKDPENYQIELSAVRKVSIINHHEKDDTNEEAATVLITIKGYNTKD